MKQMLTLMIFGILSAIASANVSADWKCTSKDGRTFILKEASWDDVCINTITGKKFNKNEKKGVLIGMSQDEVLNSSWGKPKKVNRTTNAYGTSEQWVYGGHNYLYFKDGILTSIQN